MRWKILNLADTSPFPDVLDGLHAVADITSLPASRETLERELPKFDGYLCALSLQVTDELLSECPRLRIIATPSTGWDHLNVAAMQARNIHLLSLRGEEEFLNSITATAELAWGLLLTVVRRLREATRLASDGIWARDACRGRQLSGRTLGVVGYGRLGRMMAEYGRAFRMRVLVHEQKAGDLPPGVEAVSLDRLLVESDVVSLHVHLTPDNVGLLGKSELSRIKPGAVLINTSRGAVVNETALLEALQSGHLSGAGLDVIDGEWDTHLEAHPLIRFSRENDNLVITPHIGGVTWDSQRAAYAFLAAKLLRTIRAYKTP